MKNYIGNILSILFIIAVTICFLEANWEIKSVASTQDNKNIRLYEKDYVNMYCSGEIEYILPDKTRVDCLTDEYAIEFDYAKKWAESIGQSLYYAKMTGKKPAVAIILKKDSDKKYIKRIEKIDKDIKIIKIKAVDYNDK